MKKLITCLFGGMVVMVSTMGAQAATVKNCQLINWQANKVYTISAQLHKATHVILPESIRGKPVVGNRDLWQVDGQGTHLFIKPTNPDDKEGGSTTITVIGDSNSSYDFDVKRVKVNPDLCVRIEHDAGLIDNSASQAISMWQNKQQRENEKLAMSVTDMERELEQVKTSSQQNALDAVHEYRGNIYTRYDWNRGRGFIGKDVVSDVWDDGRFTYVRVNNDNKGVLQITATLDNQEELVEYQYDSTKKLYTIAGLYPELILRYQRSKVRVVRLDNGTSGGY